VSQIPLLEPGAPDLKMRYLYPKSFTLLKRENLIHDLALFDESYLANSFDDVCLFIPIIGFVLEVASAG
jgi:hypothetical protein